MPSSLWTRRALHHAARRARSAERFNEGRLLKDYRAVLVRDTRDLRRRIALRVHHGIGARRTSFDASAVPLLNQLVDELSDGEVKTIDFWNKRNTKQTIRLQTSFSFPSAVTNTPLVELLKLL